MPPLTDLPPAVVDKPEPLVPPQVFSLSLPPADTARWFSDQVHPHGPSLAAYLRRTFPQVRDIDDVVQESFLRIWRARLARPIISAKSFLFQVARRLAIDVLRHRTIVVMEQSGDLATLPVWEESPDAAAQLCFSDKVELLAAAFVDLPPRCREIMTLRKLEGLSVREIANRLGISEGTVQNHITRGTRQCREYLVRRGVEGFARE